MLVAGDESIHDRFDIASRKMAGFDLCAIEHATDFATWREIPQFDVIEALIDEALEGDVGEGRREDLN